MLLYLCKAVDVWSFVQMSWEVWLNELTLLERVASRTMFKREIGEDRKLGDWNSKASHDEFVLISNWGLILFVTKYSALLHHVSCSTLNQGRISLFLRTFSVPLLWRKSSCELTATTSHLTIEISGFPIKSISNNFPNENSKENFPWFTRKLLRWKRLWHKLICSLQLMTVLT